MLTSFVQKLGEINPQIHTTGIFYGQKPYKHHFCDWELCCLNINTMSFNFSDLSTLILTKVSEPLTKAHIL